MGYKYAPKKSEDFRFLTDKPLSFVEKVRKGIVWVICGSENSSGGKSYYLRAAFRATRIEEYEYDSEAFNGDFEPSLCILGREGVLLRPIKLNGIKWFEDYYVAKRRYSLGIHEIMSNPIVDSLFDLVRSHPGFEMLGIQTDVPSKLLQSMKLHDLTRFVEAQQDVYESALSELKRGSKESHWMWFIFPQIGGLGHSTMAKKYAIKSRQEAETYLLHPVLGPRLVKCSRALLQIQNKSASEIMGSPDDLKLRSSMTLFARVSEANSVFHQVIDKYFQGRADQRTIEILNAGL